MNRAQFEGRTWGGVLVRGVIAIAFGILALARPGITVTSLVYLFGAYAFVDGICVVAASVNVAQMRGRWGTMFLVGLTGIIIGVLTFVNPSATAMGLLFYIAAWAIISGGLEVAAAISLRKVVEGEWALAAAGVLSIAFGVLIMARPGAGMLSLVWTVGVYALVFGGLMVGLAGHLRGTQQRLVTT